jgi:hypothetical protein
MSECVSKRKKERKKEGMSECVSKRKKERMNE